MNCIGHILIYKTSQRSYRELPLRYAELGTVYRYEKSGVLHGLLRVRGFTQDDAHIFCTPEQLPDEINDCIDQAKLVLAMVGMDDYVSKPFSLRELMVRVEAVLRRSGKTIGDERIHCGDVLFDGLNLQATCEDRTVSLTRREMDIVVYLFRHRERIVSKAELLAEVWHYKDPGVETRTVDIHILKLRKKIVSLTDESGLIETVRGEGYRLESAS